MPLGFLSLEQKKKVFEKTDSEKNRIKLHSK